MSWDAFWGALLPGIVSVLFAVAAYLKARAAEIQSRINTTKIDQNTLITKQAGNAAVTAAVAAANTAQVMNDKVDKIAQAVNGGAKYIETTPEVAKELADKLKEAADKAKEHK